MTDDGKGLTQNDAEPTPGGPRKSVRPRAQNHRGGSSKRRAFLRKEVTITTFAVCRYLPIAQPTLWSEAPRHGMQWFCNMNTWPKKKKSHGGVVESGEITMPCCHSWLPRARPQPEFFQTDARIK